MTIADRFLADIETAFVHGHCPTVYWMTAAEFAAFSQSNRITFGRLEEGIEPTLAVVTGLPCGPVFIVEVAR
ncbi:UNVERIFIED_CONTAM: hypothetical protein Q9R58_09345 [Methylobacteriaceae bacterium AG10]|nr:hypothetical protein [Methylobacteriaceae bacterium AG10]